jgi:hypothetical protein
MIVEWRPIFDGAYEVSSSGNIRRAAPGRRTHRGRPLTQILLQVGYFAVRPVRDGKNVQRYVHALVAEAFLGPRPPGMHVNHIDGIKTNNHASNLEYVTRAGNMAHAAASGLMARGSRHPASKLTEANVRAIRTARASGEGLMTICRRFRIAKPTASEICNYHSWRHVT